jgi:DNA-directed RNA polymerase subunit M/transcription elongation factor TFIIS
MKVNMDDEILAYQLRKAEQANQSGLKWFFIIAFGVFIGNSASFGLERAVLYWELQQVAKAASAALEETNRQAAIDRKNRDAQLAIQRKVQAEKDKQRQIELNQKRAGFRQANETCIFWNQQVLSQNTQQNRLYRDQACALVNQFR